MRTNILHSIARVGGLVLLMCLCRSQAQPLTGAVHAGNLPVMGWAVLSGLALTNAACMLALMQRMAAFILSLIYPKADV
ncbi:hypothetical protein GC090_22885 (plasmid) [Pantoea sp. JZ29]|uniref:hypothetical protein n=1 Tax=Pantoea sp. JZ29 TaxID=2654192 RepID=UPI002B4769B7|nr:hypothetical protein [Pantoea sp. JZ29]WRH23492.1 hypothetical protein GC090_22885 [Pantoea sp. JZ29]